MNITKCACLAIGVAAMIGTPITAKADAKLQKCSSIESDQQRLLCYDTIFPAKAKQKNLPKTQRWVITSRVDEISGAEILTASVDAGQQIPAPIKNATPSLVLRCDGGSVDVFIAWDVFVNTSPTEVTVRIDEDLPMKNVWQASTDGTATFYTPGVEMIRYLIGKRKMVVRTTPWNGSPVTTHFMLDGIDDVASKLKDTCHFE